MLTSFVSRGSRYSVSSHGLVSECRSIYNAIGLIGEGGGRRPGQPRLLVVTLGVASAAQTH